MMSPWNPRNIRGGIDKNTVGMRISDKSLEIRTVFQNSWPLSDGFPDIRTDSLQAVPNVLRMVETIQLHSR